MEKCGLSIHNIECAFLLLTPMERELAQQQIIPADFPPLLLLLPFWTHNVGVVKQSLK